MVAAYLKGTPYAKVEQPKFDWPAKTLYLTVEVFKTVQKFGGQRGAHATQREIEAWMRGGQTHWQLAEVKPAA